MTAIIHRDVNMLPILFVVEATTEGMDGRSWVKVSARVNRAATLLAKFWWPTEEWTTLAAIFGEPLPMTTAYVLADPASKPWRAALYGIVALTDLAPRLGEVVWSAPDTAGLVPESHRAIFLGYRLLYSHAIPPLEPAAEVAARHFAGILRGLESPDAPVYLDPV